MIHGDARFVMCWRNDRISCFVDGGGLALMKPCLVSPRLWYLFLVQTVYGPLLKVLLFFKKGRGFALDIDRFLLFFLSTVGIPLPFYLI